MKTFLVKIKCEKDERTIKKKRLKEIFQEYDKILKNGFKYEPPPETPKIKKRGRIKTSKSYRLLEVFKSRREDILRFIINPDVPFDNNLAERDLRMVKLKQKISGCFRTKKGANIFCRIRSYISTARKHGYNVLNALQNAMEGNPLAFVD